VQKYVESSGLTDSERGQGNLLLTSLTKQVEQLPAASVAGVAKPRIQRDSLEIPLGNNAVLRFKLIAKGKFTMGDPSEPPAFSQQVELTRPYYIGLTEVTQAQWEAMMGNNPARNPQGGDFPVDSVTYDDVQTYINTLNSKFNGKYRFRLPTEAEWEHACRAGTNTRYAFGNDRQMAMQFAVFVPNSNNESQRVGGRRPNAWGLYDMHGNVWEWVDGWYQSREPNAAPVKDPRGPEEGRFRTMRGGCFSDPDPNSGIRRRDDPFNRDRRIGFRLSVDAG
jgi:formylglycine-generating enzyme required for sulfatase activity